MALEFRPFPIVNEQQFQDPRQRMAQQIQSGFQGGMQAWAQLQQQQRESQHQQLLDELTKLQIDKQKRESAPLDLSQFEQQQDYNPTPNAQPQFGNKLNLQAPSFQQEQSIPSFNGQVQQNPKPIFSQSTQPVDMDTQLQTIVQSSKDPYQRQKALEMIQQREAAQSYNPNSLFAKRKNEFAKSLGYDTTGLTPKQSSEIDDLQLKRSDALLKQELLKLQLGAKQEVAKQKEKAALDSQKQDAQLVLSKIDEALNLVSPTSTGLIGFGMKKIPGTKATDLASVLDTIHSQLGLGKLMEMKNNSKAGASGMGQLSDREMTLLISALTSLKQSQSTDQLIKHLGEVKTRYNNILKIEEGINPYEENGSIENPEKSGGAKQIGRFKVQVH